MENDSEIKTSKSRRDFTQIAATGLLALPFLSFGVFGQKPGRRTERKPVRLAAPRDMRTEGFTTLPKGGAEEHIPPMTLESGSVQIDIHQTFDQIDGTQSGSKWRYEKSDFESINKVTVLVTNELDLSTPWSCLYGPPKFTPRDVGLKIWLQEREAQATGKYLPLLDMGVLVTLPPQLILWDAGSDVLRIETDKRFVRTTTKHPRRPNRYTHDGYTRHLRIGAIEIFSSSHAPERWITRDYDLFRIQVYGKGLPH